MRKEARRWSIYYKIAAALLFFLVTAIIINGALHNVPTTTFHGISYLKAIAKHPPKVRVVEFPVMSQARSSPPHLRVEPPKQVVASLERAVIPLDILRDGFSSFPEPTTLNASTVSSTLFVSPSSGGAPLVAITSIEHLASFVQNGTFGSRGNALIGMAAGVDDRSLAVFIKSARAAMPDAQIILLMSYPSITSAVLQRSTNVLLDLLQRNRVHVVEYREQHLQPSFLRSFHPSSLRWIFYHRIFSNYGAMLSKPFYKMIHSDVRDVQFGDDPFRHLGQLEAANDQRLKEGMQRIGRTLLYRKEEKMGDRCMQNDTTIDMASQVVLSSKMRLNSQGCKSKADSLSDVQPRQIVMAFREEDSPKLGDCTWNSAWVRDCFGQAVLDVISTSDISCSGVVIGTVPAILDYFRIFADTLEGRSSITDRFPGCERNGVDQGVHNVMLHAGLVPGTKFHSAVTLPGVVSHMQSDLYASFSDQIPPRVSSAQGVPVSIVHQYDRLEALQLKFAKYYVDWIDVNDWHAGWNLSSSQCGVYKRLVQLDLLKGECDYGSFRALTPDMCCRQCRGKQGCSGFTFAGGVCWFKKCEPSHLANIYANFTLRVALQLPLVNYIAVADELGTPVSSLVVTAILQDALTSPSVNYFELMQSLRRGYNLLDVPVKIGQGRATMDANQMLRDYFAFLPRLEQEFRRKDETFTSLS